MSDGEKLVIVIDDDPAVQVSLCDLFASVGLRCVALGSVKEYLVGPRPQQPSCLVLDINLPDMSGLEFQAKIHRHDHPPIVFLTGNPDIPSSVSAMKLGAVDFLVKPFAGGALLSAVRAAIELDTKRLLEREELNALRGRFESLTPREREVLPLIVSGLMNKQAAVELGITEITLQVHRGHVMQKMKAASLPDLVRMATKLDISIIHSRYSGLGPQ
ncbi:response regulator transcription factor [Agrobacterium genomosp. 13]|uniref:Nodulation protein W n=1 Tax=Agrobacterium genomosp. 13 str. CFBP 6927 TaxID=1183428 RepID=A0ABM9VLD3_9HYPH|nr:response regulator [Agrobacterium genomosp. 13]CUX58095.1 Nodulation protein W [Agrobacterium genomosp. 13 str. CFBP 6927]